MHIGMIYWDKYIFKNVKSPPLTGLWNQKLHKCKLLGVIVLRRPALPEALQNATTFHNRCSSTSKERRMISLPFMSNIKIDRSYLHGRAQSSSFRSFCSLRWNLALNHSGATPSFITSILTLQCSSFGLWWWFQGHGKDPSSWWASPWCQDALWLRWWTPPVSTRLMTQAEENSPSKSAWNNKSYIRRNGAGAAEHWGKPRTGSQIGLFTFSIDVNLVVYKSNNLLWGNFICSGDVLNSLTKEMQHLF